MTNGDFLERVVYDESNFGIPCFNLKVISEETIRSTDDVLGHFTAKVDPLYPKGLLHAHGFYYCDTLVEPYCRREDFRHYPHEKVTVSADAYVEELLPICHGAFSHGRFHRDFNLIAELADLRYDNWLRDLIERGCCMTLKFSGKTAGFFAYDGSKIVLHALGTDFRGKGLAKFFWTSACDHLFSTGHRTLASSVSASNLSVVNLYASLGFKFRNACDVYHKVNVA